MKILIEEDDPAVVLEWFLQAPQKTLSARVMLEHIWTSCASPREEAVCGHIRTLQQKLTAASAPRDLLKTHRRGGSQLNPLYASVPVLETAQPLTAPCQAELDVLKEELRTTFTVE